MYKAIAAITLALALGGCSGGNPLSIGRSSFDSGGFSPPAGVDYFTIGLARFSGPGSEKQAEYFKSNTADETGWRNLYIIQKEDHSELCWGRYPDFESTRPNLQRAWTYTTKKTGRRIYGAARPVHIPGADVGPAQYNLAKISDGTYTVIIGAYHNVPSSNYFGRRQDAVDACLDLRKKGEDAYFFHGPQDSIVTIGLFGPEAVKTRMVPARTVGRTEDLLDRPPMVEEKYPADPRIDAILARHPRAAENGKAVKVTVPNMATGQAQTIDKRSTLIEIPRKADEIALPGYSNP